MVIHSLSLKEAPIQRHAPLATSHTRTVLSSDPDASRLPSGDHDTLQTPPACPSSRAVSRPPATSHKRTASSSDPDASPLPPSAHDTLLTLSACPFCLELTQPLAT